MVVSNWHFADSVTAFALVCSYTKPFLSSQPISPLASCALSYLFQLSNRLRKTGGSSAESLVKAELVEAAFMNSVWDLLIVDAVLIAGTIMLPLGFEQ